MNVELGGTHQQRVEHAEEAAGGLHLPPFPFTLRRTPCHL